MFTSAASTASAHTLPGGARQFNNLNLGLYLRTAAGDTVGFYRNSINRTSVYLGRTLSWPVVPGVEVSVTAGVITGYQTGTMPFAVPSLRAGNVRLIFAPNLHGKDGAAVVSFAYEHQL